MVASGVITRNDSSGPSVGASVLCAFLESRTWTSGVINRTHLHWGYFMHAAEWIAANKPKKRFVFSMELFRVLGREHGYCTWCGTKCPPRRSSWCSKSCFEEYSLRINPLKAIENRDREVCADCRVDCARLKRLLASIPYSSRELLWDHLVARRWNRNEKLWEADHIVPVVLGGGMCGLDNYRTLCVPCHKKASARLTRHLVSGVAFNG
jgi:5-methylcytosine-specific restriction endonuclease McrA